MKYKIKINLINHHAMKAHGEVKVQLDASVISAPDGG
jgi:hypothetical protein